jgi:hypothetical protein
MFERCYVSKVTHIFGSVLQVVRVLAQAGADLNLPENRGWTALMIAASRGCVESIEALLGEWYGRCQKCPCQPVNEL